MLMVRRFARNEAGATAIEYGLIAALIACGAIVSMTLFGNNLQLLFNGVASRTTVVFGNASSSL
jgi:pilus assembly protein Flp/PilA